MTDPRNSQCRVTRAVTGAALRNASLAAAHITVYALDLDRSRNYGLPKALLGFQLKEQGVGTE
ncbi:hypothetical protein SFRURICE_006005 [Spodoptera frugiperda]|nr:hypothetical protein SFRURICE_006005 [Spodoptera frugiperda]